MRCKSVKKERKTFDLFFDWIDDLDQLPDHTDSWRVVKAISEYYRHGTNPLDLVDGTLKTVVSIIFHQIKRKETISEIRKNAATIKHNPVNFAEHKSATEYYIQNTIYTSPLQGESNAHARTREGVKPYGEFSNVYLTEEEYADLQERYGEEADKLINSLSTKIKAKGYQYDDHYAALLLWATQDGVKRITPSQSEKSYDLDEFFNAALQRSYQDLMEVHNGL